MIQAADGITAAQRINRMDFWPDFLTVASLFSIFWALTISVIVSVLALLTEASSPLCDVKLYPAGGRQMIRVN